MGRITEDPARGPAASGRGTRGSIPNAPARSTKELADRVEERLFGVRDALRLVLVGILTGNHVLLDDVPGVGKTTLVRIASNLLGLRFKRMQFTPDLMPRDITGVVDPRPRTDAFEYRAGPALHADPAGRRDQPRDAEDAVRAARGDAGAAGHRRRQTHPLPEPVLRARDAEPDRARRDVPAAGGAARPVPAPRAARLPRPSARRSASSRRGRAAARCPSSRSSTARRSRAPRRVAAIAVGPRSVVHRRARAATRAHPERRGRREPARGRSRWATRHGPSRCSTVATTSLPDDVKALAEPVFGHRLVPTTDARIRDRRADEIRRGPALGTGPDRADVTGGHARAPADRAHGRRRRRGVRARVGRDRNHPVVRRGRDDRARRRDVVDARVVRARRRRRVRAREGVRRRGRLGPRDDPNRKRLPLPIVRALVRFPPACPSAIPTRRRCAAIGGGSRSAGPSSRSRSRWSRRRAASTSSRASRSRCPTRSTSHPSAAASRSSGRCW